MRPVLKVNASSSGLQGITRRWGPSFKSRRGAASPTFGNNGRTWQVRISELEHAVDDAAPLAFMPSPAECRRLREAAGISAQQASSAVGVTALTVGQWESGVWRPRKADHRERYLRLFSVLVDLNMSGAPV